MGCGSRGYTTAFAGLPGYGLGTINNTGLSGGKWGNSIVQRSMSDVPVPETPTSNHPHKPIPGASGQLIYTET